MKKLLVFLFIVGCTMPSLCGDVAGIEESCPADAPMQKISYSPWRESKECLSCVTEYLEISSEECAKCGDIRSFEFANELCLFKKSIHKDRPLISIGGFGTDWGGFVMGEFNCDIGVPLPTTKSNCDECPERIYKNGSCYPKEFLVRDCPEFAPLKTGRGCAHCGIIYDVFPPTEQDCLVCDNRKVVREKGKESFKCVLETCPAHKPLKFSLYNQGCIGCDGRLENDSMTLWRIEVDSEEECLACPNREVVKHGDGIYCDLPSTCPPDKPMRLNNTGTCTACDNPNEIKTIPETECLKCPELREWKDEKCQFKKSPDPARPLIGSWGNVVTFESCDTLFKKVFTTKENCDLCPNRFLNDSGECILKNKDVK